MLVIKLCRPNCRHLHSLLWAEPEEYANVRIDKGKKNVLTQNMYLLLKPRLNFVIKTVAMAFSLY